MTFKKTIQLKGRVKKFLSLLGKKPWLVLVFGLLLDIIAGGLIGWYFLSKNQTKGQGLRPFVLDKAGLEVFSRQFQSKAGELWRANQKNCPDPFNRTFYITP